MKNNLSMALNKLL